MTPRPAEPGVKVFVDHKTALTLDDENKTPANFSNSPNMKDRYKDYEKTCGQIRQENTLLLDDFVALLRGQRLAPGTIRKHRENVEFFINEFLLYHDATRPAEGIGEISEFLGDWFIRKAMWSTPRYIKATATSLYKFYGFLAAPDKITLAELAELKGTIARHLAEWQARCQRYNDGDIDDWRGIG
jgi:hypothetical protein